MDLEKFKIENLIPETIQEVNEMTIDGLYNLIEISGVFRVAKKGILQGQGTYKSLYSLRKSHGQDYSMYGTFENKIAPKLNDFVKNEVEFVEPKTPIIEIIEVVQKTKRGRKPNVTK
jgi:hypothetical protein